MSVESLLKEKNAVIDALVGRFNKVYSGMHPSIFREVQGLFKKGIFNEEVILNVFKANGFEDLYLGFVDEFGELVKFGKRLSTELGIGFNLTRENFALLDTAALQIEANFKASTGKFINDLTKAGLNANIGDESFKTTVSMLKDQFADSARRFETEAFTGITQFDSAANKQLFDSAGIEKFIYFGPADAHTRDKCSSTLSDPRQSTGWTKDDIASSETPFVTRGGYNCRHEWLPYIEELDDISK